MSIKTDVSVLKSFVYDKSQVPILKLFYIKTKIVEVIDIKCLGIFFSIIS